jgi:hypothetical protein
VRQFYAVKRGGTDVVLVEGEPGAAIVVAAWMLDRLVCASMTIGAPRVSLPAFSELHQLLMQHGLRRSFPGDERVVKEASDEGGVTADPGVQRAAAARPGADFLPMNGISTAEPNAVIARFALMLMEAAGIATEGGSDDERWPPASRGAQTEGRGLRSSINAGPSADPS